MNLSKREQENNLVDEAGKPTIGGVNRFLENCRIIEKDILPGCRTEDLVREIDQIKEMFADGDREGLVQQLTRTAPFTRDKSDLSLGNARMINKIVEMALICLNTQIEKDGLIRPLSHRFSYLVTNTADEACVPSEQKMALLKIRKALGIEDLAA